MFVARTATTNISTVYDEQENTITPELDSAYVFVYTGDPCDVVSPWFSDSNDNTTQISRSSIGSGGEYAIDGLPADTYFLWAWNNINLENEWWASSGSTGDCFQAEAIVVATSQTFTGKNFQLGQEAVISGTIYDKHGKPLAEGSIDSWTEDPCEWPTSTSSYDSGSDGTYELSHLAAGDYYLQVTLMRYSG